MDSVSARHGPGSFTIFGPGPLDKVPNLRGLQPERAVPETQRFKVGVTNIGLLPVSGNMNYAGFSFAYVVLLVCLYFIIHIYLHLL